MTKFYIIICSNFWDAKFTDWLMAFGGLATVATLIYLITRGRIERFETKFYELVKFHKANVDEMNIADIIKGKKCFVPMFYELKASYSIVEEFYNNTSSENKKLYEYDRINLMDLSYKIFFYGIGKNSEKYFVNFLDKGALNLFSQVKPFLEKLQSSYNNPIDKVSLPENVKELFTIYEKRVFEFSYFPFDGHVNRLGHYYRHLFQTTNYVISQWYLSGQTKYDYIKILRAQLSTFEQLLLYYNALAWFDNEWKLVFTKYRFIKNIPLPLADFYKKPEEHFKDEIAKLSEKGIAMFEWQEG